MSERSSLEAAFATVWHVLGGPELVNEYRFDPDRKWRADFAHPTSGVLIEIEGGVWTRGRHTRGQGYMRDCEKYNAAALRGWKVFRLAGDMATDPQHIEPIIELCKQTQSQTPFGE